MSILVKRLILPCLLIMVVAQPRWCRAQDQDKPREEAAQKDQEPSAPPTQEALPGPEPLKEVQLVPTLPTVPVPRDRPTYNYQMVNASLLPRDKEGIWILDFAFKPLRMWTVEVGNERRRVHYLYYKVVNRTGKPRNFIPQFIMVNEQGKRFEDSVVPQAIKVIQAREDPTIPVRGAVNIMGIIPPSTKQGVDDAVYGIAVWDRWDPKADRFSIYVRGLSDGYKEIPSPNGGKPIVKYKTLRIDFIRRGDERNLSEKEIELSDPAYEWVYW